VFQTTAAILILSVLLLAIPVNLVFTLKKDGIWRGRIVVYWLFGLTHKTIRPGREETRRRSRRRRSLRKPIVSIGRQLVRRRRYLFSILRSEGFMRQVVYLIRDLLRSLRPRRFRLQCVMGLEDPADTGRVMGMLAPLRVFTKKMAFGQDSNVAIQVTPDFSGPRFTGHCCASVQFVPLKLIGLFMGFLFSPPVFRAAKVLIQRSNA
jgi:hypothetical protein